MQIIFSDIKTELIKLRKIVEGVVSNVQDIHRWCNPNKVQPASSIRGRGRGNARGGRGFPRIRGVNSGTNIPRGAGHAMRNDTNMICVVDGFNNMVKEEFNS